MAVAASTCLEKKAKNSARTEKVFQNSKSSQEDYLMGPLSIEVGCSMKHNACIFTCLATRAVHIEIAYTQKLTSFCKPTIRSVAEEALLNLCIVTMTLIQIESPESADVICNRPTLTRLIASMRLNGSFCCWPQVIKVGVWEHIIRSIRKIMQSLVGDKLLDDESLYTLPMEKERDLNN